MRSFYVKTCIVLAFMTLATAVACAGHTRRESSSALPETSVESIAARLTDLELRRITVRATETSETPASRDVDAQIERLRGQLRALPNRVSAERTVAQRVLVALDARDSVLGARLQEMRMVYTDTYPVVRDLAKEEELVEARRTEIRTTIGSAREGRR